MPYELCTTCDMSGGIGEIKSSFAKQLRPANFLSSLDMALDWTTEKLDRKFVTAMERSLSEDPERKKEMRLLKRTVLVLICVGLGMAAISIKFAADAGMTYTLFG